MTDKQIIIDGVDVSGCPYYIDSDGSCSSHDCECIKCIHNVCFYKDYKAKEQECEELNKQVEIFTRQLEKANKEVIKEKEKNATQRQKNEKLEQTVAEIKELLLKTPTDSQMHCVNAKSVILQKISECEVKNEHNG